MSFLQHHRNLRGNPAKRSAGKRLLGRTGILAFGRKIIDGAQENALIPDRVSGGPYVILPTQIVDTKRALDELKASVGYPLEGWRKPNFAHSTVLMQAGPTH